MDAPLPMLLGNRRMRRQPSISAFKRRSVSETGSDEARGALLMGIRRPRGFEHDSALEGQHSSLDFSPCNRTEMVVASTPPDTRDRTQAQHLINGLTLWSNPSAEEKKPFCDAYHPARPMQKSNMFRMKMLPGQTDMPGFERNTVRLLWPRTQDLVARNDVHEFHGDRILA